VTFLACLPLIPALLPAVLALDRSSLGGLWTAEGYQREMASPNSDLLVLVQAATVESLQTLTLANSTVAPKGLAVIGMGCLWAIVDEAHITTLAIDPDYHRRHLGQLMLAQLMVAARTRQLTHATLEVRISNRAAIKLYEKFGFQVAGQRKKYYQDGEDALILWRSGLQETTFAEVLRGLSQASIQSTQTFGWQWLGPDSWGPVARV
jgi:ribosomal-protein-alanine N-acetyltransferase